ncbi:hypothetical protein [Pseudomonas tolaasii]|uniref:hypothetical protein n=1 Tax=Pseudomonas tolaasii TaxID=29442 RepID=UPI00214B2981|nr:hypothetical protein [Pseudomonas tolaasii]
MLSDVRYPFFLTAMSGTLVNLGAALSAALCLGHDQIYGTLVAYYAELLPTSVASRSGYQAASIVLGGITPCWPEP